MYFCKFVDIHTNKTRDVIQTALWDGLKAGHIDMVVSDHSPCTPDLKHLDTGDFLTAWGGISSLQFGNMTSKLPTHLSNIVSKLPTRIW